MTKDIKVIKEPSRIKIGIEDTRSKILDILKEEELTIKKIAERLDKDASTIYRHIKKLEDADFVKKVEDDGETNRYSRTAHTIFLDLNYLDFDEKLDVILDWHPDFELDDLVKMDKLGYKNDRSEELFEEIQSFFTELDNKLKEKGCEIDEKIQNNDTMLLMRTKLLAYILFCFQDDYCKENYNRIFSKFEDKSELELIDGD